MKTAFNQDYIRQLRNNPPAVVTDIYDTKQPRLVIRARPTGEHTYRVLLGRGRWLTLGSVKSFEHPDKARGLAQAKLGDVAYGRDPQKEKKKERQRTLGQYIDQVYEPWLTEHRKAGERGIAELRAVFKSLLHLKLDEVSAWHIEKWRRDRLADGIKATTTNRNLTYLRAMLNRAVEWGHMESHSLTKVKALPEDRIGRLRYLSPEEEKRLRETLVVRDDQRRAERESANAWRREREYEAWPTFGTYTDHLRPMVLLALNTGLRYGELTGLCWRDVNLTQALLTVATEHAKSGRARHVPLNDEAIKMLRAWQPKKPKPEDYVFAGVEGERLVDVKTAWMSILKKAQIAGFRFHDLRHTFASKLVMAGVDLNTVRELLGHSDIKMTLRYAHLAPEHKAAAVAKLVSA